MEFEGETQALNDFLLELQGKEKQYIGKVAELTLQRANVVIDEVERLRRQSGEVYKIIDKE